MMVDFEEWLSNFRVTGEEGEEEVIYLEKENSSRTLRYSTSLSVFEDRFKPYVEEVDSVQADELKDRYPRYSEIIDYWKEEEIVE